MIEAYCCDICTEMGLGCTRSKFNLAFGQFSFSLAGCWQLPTPPGASLDRLALLRSTALAPSKGFARARMTCTFHLGALLDIDQCRRASWSSSWCSSKPTSSRRPSAARSRPAASSPSAASALPPNEERNVYNSSATFTVGRSRTRVKPRETQRELAGRRGLGGGDGAGTVHLQRRL